MFNKNKKSLVLVLISAAIVILIGYFAFAYFSKAAWPFLGTQKTDSSSETYAPPTEQEVKDSQDAKKNNTSQEQQDTDNSSPDTALKNVSVAIAYAGFDETENAIDIRAFTPDVMEANATCTATLTQGEETVTKSSKSFIDSTSSQCEPILFPLSDFPSSGAWDATVTYKSDRYNGVSNTMTTEVSL